MTPTQGLPQLDGSIFISDGGLETSLIFLDGVDLPSFAAFPLLEQEAGRDILRRYFQPYLNTAASKHVGFVLDTPTWRANPDWGAKLGYGQDRLNQVNKRSVDFARDLRRAAQLPMPTVINGVIGPRGDGYKAENLMTDAAAEDYHRVQVRAFRDAGADMVSALTMTYAEEAIGIARAAAAADIPVVISFTLETDGRLPSGDTLAAAIKAVEMDTGGAPAYYMINCAHPTHIGDALDGLGSLRSRLRGLRANASKLSHEQLDAATELDAGDPVDLGQHYRVLRGKLPNLNVLGGCCGTDHRHIDAICNSCI
jgi:homocysteine S-methyltransferase